MFLRAIAHILITAITLLLLPTIVPGIQVGDFYTALVVAVLLGLLNLTVKPILFILTLPLSIITLGLFAFVLNAFIFWLLASFVEGFAVSNFFVAFLGALILSAVSSVAHRLL